MDISKVFAILCAFLLVICLTLSITSLTVLRNAVEENTLWQDRAEELVVDLEACLAELENTESESESVSTSTKPSTETTDTDILYQGFCMKEKDGKIGIYSTDGYLITLLDVPIQILPKKDRDALKNGITVYSWRELISLIEDFGG